MKNRKAEIGTIIMMALLVLVSTLAFSSQNFLAKKQTVNTKAASSINCCIEGKASSNPCGAYGCSKSQIYIGRVPLTNYDGTDKAAFCAKATTNSNAVECKAEYTKTGCYTDAKCVTDGTPISATGKYNCCIVSKGKGIDECNEDELLVRGFGSYSSPCSDYSIDGVTLKQCTGVYENLAKNERMCALGGMLTPTPTPIQFIGPRKCSTAGSYTYPDNYYCSTNSDGVLSYFYSPEGVCSPYTQKRENITDICGPVVAPTQVTVNTPTPVSCTKWTLACGSGSKNFYKSTSADCSGEKVDKNCYGTGSSNCNEYTWTGINNQLCGTNLPPPGASAPTAGTTPGTTPLPSSTPIPTLGICYPTQCPPPDGLVPIYYKMSGVQKNFYKTGADCNNNTSLGDENYLITSYCPNYERSLTANVTLNISTTITDARSNSPYLIEILGTDGSLYIKDLDANNILPSYSMSFSRKRYANYQAEFCYETNEIVTPFCISDVCPQSYFKQNCIQSPPIEYPQNGILNFNIVY
jgi:hypothetical protein